MTDIASAQRIPSNGPDPDGFRGPQLGQAPSSLNQLCSQLLASQWRMANGSGCAGLSCVRTRFGRQRTHLDPSTHPVLRLRLVSSRSLALGWSCARSFTTSPNPIQSHPIRPGRPMPGRARSLLAVSALFAAPAGD